MLMDLLAPYSIKAATDTNQATLENMYLEDEQRIIWHSPWLPRATNTAAVGINDEYALTAYSRWGLTPFSTNSGSSVRAAYTHRGVPYVVIDNKFGSINSSGTFTQLGTNLNTSSGFAKIVSITGGADTNNQLVIIDGTNGYSYNIGTSTADMPIADANFPQTSVDITYLDDYILYLQSNSMIFGNSNVTDSTTYQALDFGSKFRKPDRIVAISNYLGKVWLLGEETIELWEDSPISGVNFSFQRRPDVFVDQGCAAKQSVCIAGNALNFLGQSKSGGYGIFQIGIDMAVKNVANASIMNLLNSFSTVSDCVAYPIAKKGHEFVVFVFPTANYTITLDLTTGACNPISTNVSNTYGRFLGNCSCFAYNKVLIGDYQSGNVYLLDPTSFTDNGTAIRRRLVTPHIYLEGKLFEIRYLQIDVQTNVGVGTFTLEMSTDHGQTWSVIDTYTVPTTGDQQIRIPALGISVVATFRITTTDNFNFIIRGFQADIAQGAW